MTKLVFNAETLAKSINSENGNEIVFEEYFDIQKSEGENPKDPKFEYFKKKILDHLAELEKKENHSIAKAIDIDEWIQKANFPVGTVRTWNGQKFKKITPKKWARIYETESRGAKLAIAALRRKVAACTNSEELLQLCNENKERFLDSEGKPLGFMQEFNAYVSELKSKHDKSAANGKKVDDIWYKLKSRENELRKKGYSDNQIDNDEEYKKLKNEMSKVGENAPEEKKQPEEKKNVGAKNSLNNEEKVKFVNKLNGEVYHEYETDPKKFAAYAKDGKATGLAMTQDIADIINSHGEASVLEWEDAIAEEIHAKYPKIEKQYVRMNISAIRMGYRNGNKEKVMILEDSKEEPKLDISKDGLKLHFEGSNKDEELKELKKIAEKAGLSVVQDSNGRTQVTNKKGDGVTILKGDTVRVENGDFIVEKPYGGTVNISKQFNGKTEEPKKTEPKQDNEPPKTDNEPKKKGIESIREKYQSSLSVEGDEDEIYVGKEAIQGKWKLVEADAPSASHDEITFHKTEGFPTAKDGSTVNDRDYEHDTAAQETVIDIASDFDGRALGFDSPIVVTQDGVVTSGNNRTMSSKIAARKGTDTKYIEALKKRAKKFGFSADDVAKFKHPRVVFETEHTGDYTTSEFAKYNESGKKAMNPVEKAVKVSKMIQPQTIEDVASIISEFDTMGDLYADKKASQSIFNTLIQSNIIQKTDLPQYYSDNTVTASGKEFLETVLIGSVINETNIRNLNTEGGRSIRQKLVRAITPLIENKGMKGYSINKELNEAVGIAIEVAHHKDQFPNVEAFSKQQDMFRKLDPVSLELAKKLEGTQKGFAEFMLDMNGGLRPAANGEVDIFLGECESKEDIVNRVLNIKKTVEKALNRFFRIFGTTM